MCVRPSCPHIFCGRCADKMREEHGRDIFLEGCPVCLDLCCCSNKTVFCNRTNHCYRKCPATKNTRLVGGKRDRSDGMDVLNTVGDRPAQRFRQDSIPGLPSHLYMPTNQVGSHVGPSHTLVAAPQHPQFMSNGSNQFFSLGSVSASDHLAASNFPAEMVISQSTNMPANSQYMSGAYVGQPGYLSSTQTPLLTDLQAFGLGMGAIAGSRPLVLNGTGNQTYQQMLVDSNNKMPVFMWPNGQQYGVSNNTSESMNKPI